MKRTHLAASLVVAVILARLGVSAFVYAAEAVEQEQAPKDGAAQPVARMDCTPFSSRGRLAEGADFRLALPRDLFVHLRAEGAFGWAISVQDRDGKEDFMWVVSPPFQSAPHRQIGPVYGLTARESAQFERRLRFVLTSEDYVRARRLYWQWRSGESTAEEMNLRRQQFRVGTLRLKLTNFSVREGVKTAFNWIEFEGEACVPQ